MKKKKTLLTLALLASAVVTGTAQASLIDRGNGLLYDDVLNVTWLQDANYGKHGVKSLKHGVKSFVIMKHGVKSFVIIFMTENNAV